MSTPTPDEAIEDDGHFLEHSVAEGIVPANANLSIEELFEQEEEAYREENVSLLPWIKQRDFLLLGTRPLTSQTRRLSGN